MKFKHPLLKLLIFIVIGYSIGQYISLDTITIIISSVFALALVLISKLSDTFKYSIISLLIGIILNNNVDILIIGAGPSGSVAAAYLHQKGYTIKVVEKNNFPRFVIGESLKCLGGRSLSGIGF